MKNTRSDAHGFESFEAPDAEKEFLTDSRSAVAAVQTRRQMPVFRRITRHVGIQKNDVAAADLQPPDFRADRTRTCLDLYDDGFAVRADDDLHRQFVHVRFEIFL